MTTPIPAEDLPRLLAEAMNWVVEDQYADGWWKPCGLLVVKREWKPHLSHEHAQICVEECEKKKRLASYCRELLDICSPKGGSPWVDLQNIVLATPEQKARASLAALTGK
jgi:hypothetical protein